MSDEERALSILLAMLRNFDRRLSDLEGPLSARGIAGRRGRELAGAFQVMLRELDEIGEQHRAEREGGGG